MPCIMAFIGTHNSGKTTIATQVASILETRGYSTGVLKSTHHDTAFHPPGKDTTLYRDAGVGCVAVTGPYEIAFFESSSQYPLETLVFRLFPDQDIVLLEGFKKVSGVPKIEVAVTSPPVLYKEVQGVKAVITGQRFEGRPVLNPDHPEKVTDFIEETILNPYMKEDEVSIFINNRRLPLKLFIKNAVKGLVTGFLKSLKFTDGARKIDIRIVLR